MGLDIRSLGPKRISLTVSIVAALALVAFLSIHRGTKDSPQYTVAKVARGSLVQSIATTGTLTPLVAVDVSSQISGLITDVEVDFNSVVRKGQVLARIDPATYEAKLEQAKANLAAAQAAYDLSRINAARFESLRKADLVSKQDYDQTMGVLQQSRANLRTQEAAVRSAQTDLDRCVITSPIDGVVIYRQAEVGKTIVSSFAAPTLFTVARDLDQMRILAPVSEVDIWSVKAGQPVSFTVDALPGRVFRGRITQVRAPYTPSDNQQQIQQQQGAVPTFNSVIEVDNQDRVLRPSVTALVSVVVAEHKDVLKVPAGALSVQIPDVPRSQGSTVYRLPGGDRKARPEPIPVTVGISDGVMTEISGGLKEGDVLVTGTASTWEPEKRSLFN